MSRDYQIERRIRVMISSCSSTALSFRGADSTLREVRQALKEDLESLELGGLKLFTVWINEEERVGAHENVWDACTKNVRWADTVVAIYNGDSGWTKDAGDNGICHEELKAAFDSTSTDLLIVQLPEVPPARTAARRRADQRFRDYVQSLDAWAGFASNGDEVLGETRKALAHAVLRAVPSGIHLAKRSGAHVGSALKWSLLQLESRHAEMVGSLSEALLDRDDVRVEPVRTGDDLTVVRIRVDGVSLVCRLHAVPAAFSVPAARERLGQPFLYDHALAPYLADFDCGPIHIVSCFKTVSESQAMRQLGFPDATFLSPAFGVFAADEIQRTQTFYLNHCRDEDSTRNAVRQLFAWMREAGEWPRLLERAQARRRIIDAIGARPGALPAKGPQREVGVSRAGRAARGGA